MVMKINAVGTFLGKRFEFFGGVIGCLEPYFEQEGEY
jgi:hypothetical protein